MACLVMSRPPGGAVGRIAGAVPYSAAVAPAR